jgi:hypothetical protein
LYDFSSRDGEFRTRRRGNRGFDYDEPTTTKRIRRQTLPPVDEATEGLPEGDRWSTWDQSETPIPKQCTPHQLVADTLF